MKTKLLSAALGFLCSVVLLTGCNEDNKKKNPTPPEPPAPLNFTMAASGVVYDGFTVIVTPKDKNVTYHCSYVEKSILDEYGDDSEYINVEVAKIQNAATKDDKSFSEFAIEHGLIVTGESKLTLEATLDAGTEYCVYAYLLTTDGKFDKVMDKIFIITPPAPAVVMRDEVTLDFELTNIEPHAFGLAMYCSDPKMYVFTGYMTVAKYDTIAGGTPQGIIDLVEGTLASDAGKQGVTVGAISRANCLRGTQLLGEFFGAPANTPYIAYAIGFDSQGRRVTKIKTFEYKTLEEIYSKALVELTAGKFYDGNELIKVDSEKYKAYKDKAYALLYVEPNADAANWFVRAGETKGISGQADDILTKLVMQKGTKNVKAVVIGAEWDVDYLFLGVGVDADELPGVLVKKPVKCTKSGVSPISDITESSAPASMIEFMSGELANPIKASNSFGLNLKQAERIHIR